MFRTASDYARMTGLAYWSCTLAALHRLGETVVEVARPKDDHLPREGSVQRADEVATWMAERARTLATRFDERNGNRRVSATIADLLDAGT